MHEVMVPDRAAVLRAVGMTETSVTGLRRKLTFLCSPEGGQGRVAGMLMCCLLMCYASDFQPFHLMAHTD